MTPNDAARCAPVICLDEREPFPPLCAGYSVISAGGVSPSFQRELTLEPPAACVIEYAIWWDWDIGHLLELEHVWVYLDSAGCIIGCEGSWHGFYRWLEVDGAILLADGRPLVYAQPGKHALGAAPADFESVRAETERECTLQAGRSGLLIPHLYLGRLRKDRADDERIRSYLQRRAFVPAWRFTRRVPLTPEMLVPWPELEAYIPPRVEWWLARLRAAENPDEESIHG